MAKDEDLRSLLRKRGYNVLELSYDGYSDRKRDQLYEEIRASLKVLVLNIRPVFLANPKARALVKAKQ